MNRKKSVDTQFGTIDLSNSLSYLGTENDKRYLVSACWWQEWCDYTNFDLKQPKHEEIQ